MGIVTKIFGTHSEREIKRITPIVNKIESYRDDMMALSDSELRGKTDEFKKRLAEGETLDDIMPEAYAVVREATRRVINQEHYRVQLMGGIILHQGRIAEMRTGEGKTLVSTLPAYLNALEGKGVLVANDISNARAKALLKNLELFGISNAFVTNEVPGKLAESFEGFFDKVMVDAPCSGEGMFRKDPEVIKTWDEERPEYFAKLQKDILKNAVKMLRPGGLLFYSTCTMTHTTSFWTSSFFSTTSTTSFTFFISI